MKFKIAWKNLDNARSGLSGECYSQLEAAKLARELNIEHPGFDHVPVLVDPDTLRPLVHPQFREAPAEKIFAQVAPPPPIIDDPLKISGLIDTSEQIGALPI